MMNEYFSADKALSMVIGGLTDIISVYGIFLEKLSNRTLWYQYNDLYQEQKEMKNQLINRFRALYPEEDPVVPAQFGARIPAPDELRGLSAPETLKLLNSVHTPAIDLFEDISLRCEDPISGEFIHITADRMHANRMRFMKDIHLNSRHDDYFH